MRSIKVILLLAVFIVTCKSPEKLLQKGNYDAVIVKTVKNILKGKADDEDKELMDKAYHLANQQDEERIRFLKAENRPENWEEIFRRYNALNRRQNEIRKVSPVTIGNRQITYDYTDYTDEIVEAKSNAARYYYDKGQESMTLHTKEGYRQAYFNFQKAGEYRASDYPDLNTLIQDARYFGTSRVLIEAVNNSRIRLPDEFINKVVNVNTSGLNSTWVEYYIDDQNGEINYDYIITIELQNIIISPEEISKHEYMKTKEVDDGFEYVLDRRGNVMKDSLGNDIKVPKYRQISCTIIETKQFKTATINGMVKFRSINPGNVLKTEPVAATSVFEHMTARAIGDLDALEPVDRKFLRNEILPFPDDFSMLFDCSETLKQAARDVIYNNRRIIN